MTLAGLGALDERAPVSLPGRLTNQALPGIVVTNASHTTPMGTIQVRARTRGCR
jgi:hypothetical protein